MSDITPLGGSEKTGFEKVRSDSEDFTVSTISSNPIQDESDLSTKTPSSGGSVLQSLKGFKDEGAKRLYHAPGEIFNSTKSAYNNCYWTLPIALPLAIIVDTLSTALLHKSAQSANSR
jgi:hypothetical protein